MKFIELLKGIIKRPGMFSVNQVEDLGLIIFGYLAANTNDADKISELMSSFQNFVAEKFEMDKTLGWQKIIKLYSGSNSHSVQLFNQLFEEFLEGAVY